MFMWVYLYASSAQLFQLNIPSKLKFIGLMPLTRTQRRSNDSLRDGLNLLSIVNNNDEISERGGIKPVQVSNLTRDTAWDPLIVASTWLAWSRERERKGEHGGSSRQRKMATPRAEGAQDGGQGGARPMARVPRPRPEPRASPQTYLFLDIEDQDQQDQQTTSL